MINRKEAECSQCGGAGRIMDTDPFQSVDRECRRCDGSGSVAQPPVEISFKAAWDVWCEEHDIQAHKPDVRAAMRVAFVAGWRARGAVNGK